MSRVISRLLTAIECILFRAYKRTCGADFPFVMTFIRVGVHLLVEPLEYYPARNSHLRTNFGGHMDDRVRVAHIYFGDGQRHPIITSYLDNPVSDNTLVDTLAKGKLKKLSALFWRLLWLKKHDFYHCHDVLSCALSFVIKGPRRTIFDAHEIYYDYMKNSIMRRVGYVAERVLHECVKTSIFPNQQRADHFALYKRNVRIIQNLLNDKISSNQSDTYLEVKDEKNYFLLVGTINSHRGVDQIIEAIQKVSNVELHYYGDSFDLISHHASKKIRDMGLLPRDQLIKKYPEYKASLALYSSKSVNNRLCAPTKLFENEYFGIKTIINRSDYVCQLVSQGYVENIALIPEITVDNLTQVITQLRDASISRQIQSGRPALLWSSQAEVIRNLYD